MSGIRRLTTSLNLWCFEGVDPLRLDTFRRVLSATFLMYAAFRFAHAREWLTDAGFHASADDIRADLPAPWPTMGGEWVPLFGVALFGSSLCLVVGSCVRWMQWVVFACSLYLVQVDCATVCSYGKLYVVCFAVLACAPSPREVVGNDGRSRTLQSVWPIRVLQATLLIQYFTAGTCKVLHGDWHWNQPYVLWAQVQGSNRTEVAAYLLNSLPKAAWAIFMFAGLAFELLSPLLFLSRRLYRVGLAWGMIFHLAIALLMENFIYFSAMMVSLYALFLNHRELLAFRSWFARPKAVRPMIGILVFLLGSQSAWASDPPQAVLVQLVDGQRLTVRSIEKLQPIKLPPNIEGLIVWSNRETEAWQLLPAGSRWMPPRNDSKQGTSAALRRGREAVRRDPRHGKVPGRAGRGNPRLGLADLRLLGSERFRRFARSGDAQLAITQDRLGADAFQKAAGGRPLLMAALHSWQRAESNYLAAEAISDEQDSNTHAGLQVYRARLQFVLADILRGLEDDATGRRTAFVEGIRASARDAAELANEVLATHEDDIQPLVRAAASEILAQVAFRELRSQECLAHARLALSAYAEEDSLAGEEGIRRLLGWHYVRLAEQTHDPLVRDAATTRALHELTVSLRCADVLYSRLPRDGLGQRRAAFCSRRASVYEQIIKLLVERCDDAQALYYSERARARTLGEAIVDDAPRTTVQVLANWPRGVAAIEYFLGIESAWLFSVDTTGQVKVWNLLRDGGTSLELVTQVRAFLDDIAKTKPRMLARWTQGQGYDDAWQDRLFALRRGLLPAGLLEQLQTADTVVVVPHHVLHYFPFAALVTRRDERPASAPLEMVHPRFLADESFDLTYSPSLAAWNQLRSRPDILLNEVNAAGIVDAASQLSLPGVGKDLEQLRAAFGTTVNRILVEQDATESNIRRLLGKPGMLFLAMHGSHRADRPLDSFLACQGDGQHDGHLTTRELLSVDTRPDLVLVGCCDSALGERSPPPSDEVRCLSRAFLQSGARTVVSTLWDVDDGAGPELMRRCFDHLARGESAVKALAESQRAFLRQSRGARDDPWGHPYFWAVYTAAGDDRTRFAP